MVLGGGGVLVSAGVVGAVSGSTAGSSIAGKKKHVVAEVDTTVPNAWVEVSCKWSEVSA